MRFLCCREEAATEADRGRPRPQRLRMARVMGNLDHFGTSQAAADGDVRGPRICAACENFHG